MPKLTAVRGNEDYTYSNYFLGRNEFDGFASQQIMMRDGGLKIRTDLFQSLQGRSDNWIASLNLTSSLPRGLLPFLAAAKTILRHRQLCGRLAGQCPDKPVSLCRRFTINPATIPDHLCAAVL